MRLIVHPAPVLDKWDIRDNIENDFQYQFLKNGNGVKIQPMPSSTRLDHWLDIFQSSGCRLTPARLAVLEVLANSNTVLSPMQIFLAARNRAPRLGLVSVYRTLEILENLKLIQRVHQPDGCQGFINAASGHQHLLICVNCGRAVYFEGDDVTELAESLKEKFGFHILDHWLQFEGICRDCQSKNPSDPEKP